MFENFIPKYKIGCMQPNDVIDNSAYEFYRLAPHNVMYVMTNVGLTEFSREDVERAFEPMDVYIKKLLDRGVDMVMQNGVPLPILIGVEAHDKLVDYMAKTSGKPATTTVLCVVQGTADLGVKKVAVVNKWTEAMNQCLAEFFARGGVKVVGKATKSLHPADFHRIDTADHMQLAYELGKRAFQDNPDADAVYIGGGSWIAEPVAQKLEQEYGKPVICNMSSVIRHTLKMLGGWQPIAGHSRLLGTA
jgi:maleate cis-trans isomerase